MITYIYPFDTWLLTFDPSTAPEEITDGIDPTGDFTAQAHVTYLPNDASAGLFWRAGEMTFYWLTRHVGIEEEPPFFNVIPRSETWLRIEYDYVNELVRLSSSSDQLTWQYHRDIYSPEAPGEVGVVLVPDTETPILEQTSIADYRLFNEVITPAPPGGLPTQQLDVPFVQSDPGLSIGTFSHTVEPHVHGLLSAQFGDLEVDIGKSAVWLQFLVDDLFITDINTGDQRYWVVNWSATLPEAKYNISGTNFFVEPQTWRREQFEAASKAWNYGDDDWCVFIDGHECLSFDNRSLPDDFDTAFLKSWIYREIARAVERGHDQAYLPFFAYLKYTDLQNVTYPASANPDERGYITQAISVPWYYPAGWLCRLIKVSALRDLDFDWSSIDVPIPTPPAGDPPSTDAKAQVISYGYMHWNRLDVDPGFVEVEELNEANDDGYRMRCLLSMARPISGIPYGDPYGKPWYDPSTDPVSYPGPWAVDTMSTLDPLLVTTIEESGHTAPHALTAGVGVPLYDTVARLNLRDGLWYEAGVSGNVPLAWDDTQQVWVPLYSPDQWEELGIDADLLPEPPPSNMALRMNGVSGTYTRTSDSAFLDYAYGFTLTASLAPNDWTPATRKVIVSKWGAAGQRSYYWALDPDGIVVVTSRDGTVEAEAKLVYNFGILGDGEMVDLAVSFATDNITKLDKAIFWRQVSGIWVPLNELAADLKAIPVTAPNPDYLPLFNSTAEIEVGARTGGTVGNFAGLFRLVSIRSGVGEDTVGGAEQARMRGDLTSNPTYDIYGNTWSNFGGWDYEAVT